jgi:chaperonin GroES
MKIKPLHDRVLVECIEAESKTAGGIIIPDTAKEKPAEGKVVSVGEGLRDDHGKRIALDVKNGDRILFAKWSGNEIEIDRKQLLILKESDILAILES